MNPHAEQRGGFNAYFLFSLGAILLCLIIVAYFFYGLQPVAWGKEMPDDKSGPAIEFTIEKNQGFRSIASELSKKSLIKSIAVFKAFSLVTGKAHKFQPGIYELTPSMSVPEILKTLTSAGTNEAEVTIPEGSTLKDAEDILVRAHVLKSGELTNLSIDDALKNARPYLNDAKSLEGFIFPDTYRFHRGADVKEVIAKLLGTFESKALPLLKDKSNWYDILTLASLIEREVREFEDRQIVAGILLKRIRIGMPLQVDATISYAKCEGKFRSCEEIAIRRAEVSFPSIYNTYLYRGVPPTPISNPGVDAIKATLSPITTPYYYYLSARTGETYFSKNLQEHNIKREKYL